MRLKTNWFHAAIFALVVAGLGFPPARMMALGQQQGPQSPPPAQQPLPPQPPTQQNHQPQPAPADQQPKTTIVAESNLVNIDATVTDQDGNVLKNLKRDNFRVLADNQPQQISNFSPSDAPITIVVLMEFSRLVWGYFGYEGKRWAYNFLPHLNDKDWVAFKTYDLKTTLQVDFTRDKNQVAQAIASLYFPDFTEANMFDAIIETLNEMRDVQGKKSILLIASGYDTFSKHTLDQTYKRLKETDVTIFCIGMAEALEVRRPNGGGVTFMQSENELKTFGEMTGGYAWFPRFEGEMPSIFNSVATLLRSQYTIGFSPTIPSDGKFHKLKVDVLDDQGNPLTIPDHKGHPKKVVVYARQGYTAPKPSPAD